MNTMSMMATRPSADTSSILRGGRPTIRRASARVATGRPVWEQHLARAADATLRFGIALVPFSALAWMFAAC